MAKKKTVGIRALKDHLSAYVHAVDETGEEVLVTDHGREVARLVGVAATAGAPRFKFRPAAKSLADLSFMKPRRPSSARPRPADLDQALDFTRADKELP
jgi:prevent-host-death family protein